MIPLEEMLSEFEQAVKDMTQLPRGSDSWEDARQTWRIRRAELLEICPDEVLKIEARWNSSTTSQMIQY